MADEQKEVAELDLDGTHQDLEAAMRAAVQAVEAVEEDSAPAAGPAAEPAAENGAESREIAMLRREIADLRDRSMRTLADFDNFRKRSERERQEAKRYALLEPLRDFLAVVDNLDRALRAQGSAEDLKRGVEMTLRQFQEQLRRHGVREVVAQGAPFDPALHEAVSRQEDPAVQQPTVVEELQRGYMMHDRLLRPAMVKVAVPAEKPPAGNPPPASAGGDGGTSVI
jgi:molecular chaperone GrpE